MSGKLRQAARKFADSTIMAAQPFRWAVQVKTTTNRQTTGLVEVERVGTGREFWAQVRNSVYLAAGDLVWVVKDPSAQGNWIFDGFVTGAGTGESLNGSPIPSVQTPVVTSPDGTPLIIRPIAGQQGTIGRVNETINFAGAINVTQGITFASLGAGIVQSSAGGVLSSDYTIDATTTWATGTNILPTDASGQAFGDATHRWDLYTQAVSFLGATGTNSISVPTNLADALHVINVDTDDVYFQLVTTTNTEAIIFNPGGNDVDFTVQASGVADAFLVQGSDGQITLGALTAGVVSSSAGGVLSVTAGSAIVGSGANTQVAYWTAANTLAGEAAFTYNAATNVLSLDGDLTFTGAQSIRTTAGDLNINPAGDIYLVDDVRFLAGLPTNMYVVSGATRRLFWQNTGAGVLDHSFDGRLAIGNDFAPGAMIDIRSTVTTETLHSYFGGNAAGDRPVIKMNRARTSIAAPSLVANNDQSFSFLGTGYDGAAYQIMAGFTFEVDGVAAAGDMPGRIVFETTPAGTVVRVEAMRIDNAGYVGLNRPAPQGLLHGYDAISGFMHWEYDGLAGAAQTVIPNAAGDVTSGVTIMYRVEESGGGTDGGMVMVLNGAAVDLYDDGVDVCTLTVAADGSVTVVRSAGAATFKVALWLLWI